MSWAFSSGQITLTHLTFQRSSYLYFPYHGGMELVGGGLASIAWNDGIEYKTEGNPSSLL